MADVAVPRNALDVDSSSIRVHGTRPVTPASLVAWASKFITTVVASIEK